MKKLLLAIIVFVMLMVTAQAEEWYGDLQYDIYDGNAYVCGCRDTAISINIPSTIEGYPVMLTSYAFSYCTNLKEVNISDGITKISTGAFDGCTGLEDITIPDSVEKISVYAFENCTSLKSITIPDGIKAIEKATFYGCKSLENIIIPNSVESIGGIAFAECSSLRSVTIPFGVKKIERFAFRHSGLTEVKIFGDLKKIEPDTFCECEALTDVIVLGALEEIPEDAFFYVSNVNITIPDSVRSISEGAFYGSENVVIKGTADSYAREYALKMGYDFIEVSMGTCGDTAFWLLDENGLLTIYGKGDMYDWSAYDFTQAPWRNPLSGSAIKSVVIEEGITSVGSEAFRSESKLTNVKLPDSIKNIKYRAFLYCDLSEITLPEGLVEIGNAAFEGNPIEEIMIPKNVTKLGQNVFDGIKKYSVHSENPTFSADNKGVLFDKQKTTLIAFPAASDITVYTVPNTVNNIKESAFAYCRKITEVTVPDSVTEIKDRTFDECWELEKVNLPNTITKIGFYAFQNTGFVEFVIPNSVKEIKDRAFTYCLKLESVTIPEGVTSIGARAFNYCESLKSVTIPKSVVAIGYLAFGFCDNKDSIDPIEGFTMTGYVNSAASRYAKENGIPFNYLDTLPGDISGDGTVDLKDVTTLRRHLAGGYNVEVVEAALDVNSDGTVDLKDVTYLRRALAGGYGIEL